MVQSFSLFYFLDFLSAFRPLQKRFNKDLFNFWLWSSSSLKILLFLSCHKTSKVEPCSKPSSIFYPYALPFKFQPKRSSFMEFGYNHCSPRIVNDMSHNFLTLSQWIKMWIPHRLYLDSICWTSTILFHKDVND